MKKTSLLFAALGLFMASCSTPATPAANTTATSPSATTTTTPAVAPTAEAKMVNAEGKLIEVEDAGYPMAYISLMPNGQSTQISINFSQEGSPAFKVEDLNKMLNKTVAVEYEEKITLEAIDVQIGGKSIVGGAPTQNTDKMSGTLVATEATQGDLPSKFSLKTADGQTIDFEYFVTPEMVAQNGKTVDVFTKKMPRLTLKKISAK